VEAEAHSAAVPQVRAAQEVAAQATPTGTELPERPILAAAEVRQRHFLQRQLAAQAAPVS
jgi:hypothetical protein